VLGEECHFLKVPSELGTWVEWLDRRVSKHVLLHLADEIIHGR
jgi:hypothetical protein